MKLQKISKRTRGLWYIRNSIILLIVSLIMLCAVVTAAHPLLTVIAGISWLIIAALLLIWPALAYNNYTYGYDDKRFYIAYGVIFKHEITAPLCQIQDLHFFEGPVMQLFKIGKVMFATGGSNFDLTGLDKAVAHTLIKEVEVLLRARIEENTDEDI